MAAAMAPAGSATPPPGVASDLAPLATMLASTRLRDIAAGTQDIVSLQHNATVGEALRLLAAARILSAPVVVSSGLEDFENGELPPGDAAPSLLGWLDVSDVVRAFLDHLHEKKLTLPRGMLQLMALLEKEGPDFADKMVVTVIGSEDRGLLYQADASTSVLSAIQGLFLGATNAPPINGSTPKGVAVGGSANASGGPTTQQKVVHRLAVFNALGEITHIVSQLDIIRYLVKHRAAMGPVATRGITELGLLEGKGPLVVLQPHTPTLQAFESLAAAGVTGAPVIASDGELIANLSVSDIRCIEPAHFGILALPLAEFLALSHGTSYLGYSARGSGQQFHPFFSSTGGASSAGFGRGGGPAAAAAAAAAAGRSSSNGGGMPPPSPRGVLGRQSSGAFGGGAPPSSPLQRRRSLSSGGGADSGGGGAVAGGAAASPLAPGLRAVDPDAADEEQRQRGSGGGAAAADADMTSVPLITCGPDSALIDVLELMVRHGVHRIYVYTPDCRPAVAGVVTPTDVLRLLVRMGLGGANGGAAVALDMPAPARPAGAAGGGGDGAGGMAKRARLDE